MTTPFPDGTIYSFEPNTPHFIYSNFYPHSVSFEGITFPSNEHAYQAAKSLDEDIRRMIMRCGSAATAKKLGRTIQIRPNWNEIKLQIMYDLLKQKFSNEGLGRQLWTTGDREIIEGNYWHDVYWGKCFCPKHNWEGQNFLGRLIKKVRLELDGWRHWNASV